MSVPASRCTLPAVLGLACRSSLGVASTSREAAGLVRCTSQRLDGDYLATYRHFSICTARSDAAYRGSSLAVTEHFRGRTATFSTFASASSQAAAGQETKPKFQALHPGLLVPAEARAKLADELGSDAAARGRRTRRPLATAQDSPDAAAAAGGLGPELDDAEVQVVLDKLVGGLTKSGRKSLARRVVLDTFRVMRQHLRKGNLEELK